MTRRRAHLARQLARLSQDYEQVSGHNPEAARVLLSLSEVFREILRVLARVAPTTGTLAPGAGAEAFDVAEAFTGMVRALRFMLKRGAWGTALYDVEQRKFVMAAQEDDIQARESFNSARIRERERSALEAALKRQLSGDPDPMDLHDNAVEQLNPEYTKSTFAAVMKALRERALAQARDSGLCSIVQVERTLLEDKLAADSGVGRPQVAAVLGDLVFAFDPKQDGQQCLLEIDKGQVAIIPLLVMERTLDASEYVRISKSRYPGQYGNYQDALTRSLEDKVGEVLRGHAPQAEVRPLMLPGVLGKEVGGEVDQIAADPQEDALLLVQVKYLLDHDNDRIAEGVAQLQRDERVIRERWPEVAEELRGWQGRPFPARLSKLLVTNWFLGTEGVPPDIRVVSLDDLRAIPPAGSLLRLMQQIADLPESRVLPEHENKVALFGYTFVHYTSKR